MPTLQDATRNTLNALNLQDSDEAAATLALKLAESIDNERSGRTISELSSRFNAILNDLGATPAARKALTKEVPRVESSGNTNELAALRARRNT